MKSAVYIAAALVTVVSVITGAAAEPAW